MYFRSLKPKQNKTNIKLDVYKFVELDEGNKKSNEQINEQQQQQQQQHGHGHGHKQFNWIKQEKSASFNFIDLVRSSSSSSNVKSISYQSKLFCFILTFLLVVVYSIFIITNVTTWTTRTRTTINYQQTTFSLTLI